MAWWGIQFLPAPRRSRAWDLGPSASDPRGTWGAATDLQQPAMPRASDQASQPGAKPGYSSSSSTAKSCNSSSHVASLVTQGFCCGKAPGASSATAADEEGGAGNQAPPSPGKRGGPDSCHSGKVPQQRASPQHLALLSSLAPAEL